MLGNLLRKSENFSSCDSKGPLCIVYNNKGSDVNDPCKADVNENFYVKGCEITL